MGTLDAIAWQFAQFEGTVCVVGDAMRGEVYPALFNRVNTAFPEFGWRRTGNSWTATLWPQEFPHRMGHGNPTRHVVYQDRPWRISIQGHYGVRFLAYVNGGQIPSPTEYIHAARIIFEKAGVPISRVGILAGRRGAGS